MSTYLDRLKEKTGAKRMTEQPPKPPKGSSGGFGGDAASVFALRDFDTNDGVYEERAAICEHDGGLSRDHAEQLAALHAAPLPEGITEQQRAIVIDAAARFLDRRRNEARKAGAK
jgi:hypothetical protein